MSGDELATLAGRLGRLFREVLKEESRPDGTVFRRNFTNEEVAAAIKADKPEVKISANYLGQLRNGAKDNPSMPVLVALAQFFKVPVGYLAEPQSPEQAQAEIDLARLRAHPKVQALAMRALSLDTKTVAAITQMVEALIEDHKTDRR